MDTKCPQTPALSCFYSKLSRSFSQNRTKLAHQEGRPKFAKGTRMLRDHRVNINAYAPRRKGAKMYSRRRRGLAYSPAIEWKTLAVTPSGIPTISGPFDENLMPKTCSYCQSQRLYPKMMSGPGRIRALPHGEQKG